MFHVLNSEREETGRALCSLSDRKRSSHPGISLQSPFIHVANVIAKCLCKSLNQLALSRHNYWDLPSVFM